MPLRPKIFDRYLSREFLVTLAGVLAACAVVVLIAKVFEEFDEIADSPASFKDAVLYFLYVLPYRLIEIIPLITMLAVIFSVGNLAQNREMLAMTASGQSPYRSAGPIFVCTLAISAIVIVSNETFVPYCQEKVEYYEDGLFKGRGETIRERRRDIFEKGIGNTFFSMTSYDGRRHRMENVLIWEQSEDSKIWRHSLKAKSADLVKRNISHDRDLWRFQGAVEHNYDEAGRPIEMIAHTEPLERELETGLDSYLANRKEPEQMDLRELWGYMQMLKRRQQDISGYLTDWYLKLVFPFSTVALGMIAFALAIRAHTASLPLAFGVGVFLTMLFYALAAMGQALGQVAVIPPIVGALGPIAVFFGLGLYLLRRSGFAA